VVAMNATAELQVEPIVGWRVWDIAPWESHDGRTEPRLAATVFDSAWPPGRPLEASCLSHEHHDAPNVDHDCGVYALRSEEAARRIARTHGEGTYAIGRVS
jgi:hypothetical protein